MTPMREPDSRPSPWRHRLVLAVFVCYALALILTARHLAHAWWSGWIARLLGMGLVAVGLAPWLRWLRPRLTAALNLAGRALLLTCYLVCLAPFAVLIRLIGASTHRRREPGSSNWLLRKPLPSTLDASRLEY